MPEHHSLHDSPGLPPIVPSQETPPQVPTSTDVIPHSIQPEQHIPRTILRRIPNVPTNSHSHNTRFKHATFHNWVSIRTIGAPQSTPTRLHKIF